MKITHDNKSYILDVQRSIDLGVLKPEKPPYVPRVGDVFVSGGCGRIKCVLIQKEINSPCFNILGNRNDLGIYSDTPKTAEKVISQFMDGDWIYKGNINDEFKTLLADFCKKN